MLGLHCCKWPFSVVAASGLLSSWSVPASHCSDFCLCFSKFLLIYYLFIFVAALGLFRCMWTSSGCSSWGLLSRCRARASHCSGFSCGAGTRGAGRHSSRGARAQLLCGTWGLPGAGIRSMPPALAGRFFTSRPPGESLIHAPCVGRQILYQQTTRGVPGFSCFRAPESRGGFSTCGTWAR